jgi:hypothetical protein
MNMIYAVPDQSAVRLPQFTPEADVTPTECFENGDYWAADSLMRWVRQPENEQYMLDIFCERNASPHRDEAIKQWDAQVQAGEWS